MKLRKLLGSKNQMMKWLSLLSEIKITLGMERIFGNKVGLSGKTAKIP